MRPIFLAKNYFAGQKIWAFCKLCVKIRERKTVSGQKKWAFGQKFLKSGQPKTVGAQRLSGFLAKNPKIFNI